MSNIVALRFYFQSAEKALPSRKLHRFFRPSLASHLLRHAAREGIEQVIFHQVHAGYLKGQRMSARHVETIHPSHPHCIELIDIEEKLRDFLRRHEHHLAQARVIFMRAEMALGT
ncbi:DUF190 domain-containing protein [Pollutimonas bauzanensis]|uniref:Uncharacterized ACR, COG1993 n=1 Tax=Pollutimonas bauzanensis TaxID=658167 RepID=A0A1M6AUQ5_9BURK|nr:DUF190 domain-containing protein [Pollutimonas bauzanensis]SHI06272.1 Uncharacterized ACR, COG1993 [Pollutimonas bauzanensis]SHI39953.1 Uncharacterized ACR, COG1993 [Pollutimonas bauzanensis]